MNTEYMGWFGLTWQEKVAAAMYKILGPDYKKDIKAFGQPGGYNINLVNALYNGYSLDGFVNSTAEGIAEITKIDIPIVNAFTLALSDLAIKGNIEYKLFDPQTVKESTVIKTDMLTPAPVKKLESYAKAGIIIVSGILILKALSYLPKGA